MRLCIRFDSTIACLPILYPLPYTWGWKRDVCTDSYTARARTYTCGNTFADHHSAAHTVTARARRNKIDQERDTFSGRAWRTPTPNYTTTVTTPLLSPGTPTRRAPRARPAQSHPPIRYRGIRKRCFLCSQEGVGENTVIRRVPMNFKA